MIRTYVNAREVVELGEMREGSMWVKINTVAIYLAQIIAIVGVCILIVGVILSMLFC